MDWASAIFPFDVRTVKSVYVDHIWRTKSTPVERFVSTAIPNWEIVFVRSEHAPQQTFIRGPETIASIADVPPNSEFIGVQFKLGAFLADHPPTGLVDTAKVVEMSSSTSVWLGGATREIPVFETATSFVEQLVRDGSLLIDPIVADIMARQHTGLTTRSEQRRFLRATGLTYACIRQMQRVDRAAKQLQSGATILDVVDNLRFSDQSHLTRATTRFLGKSPAKIASGKD